MFEATRYRAYFRKVTILVPTTWKKKPEYESPSNDDIFKNAAVRIDKQNPKVGHTPYALSYAQCGRQAKYIHLTPKFVTDVTFAESTYGKYGR
jgi:hypothetical protein